MYHFCTISTNSHLYKTLALADSLEQGNDFVLHVLLVDNGQQGQHPRCRFWKAEDIKDAENAARVMQQYRKNKDKLRWCLKPVFLNFLLQHEELQPESVIYIDNDIFFYNNYTFLFDLLKQHSFLLTPHYYRNDPRSHQNWFEANFRVGLYNAGFVGASQSAAAGLNWWANCCLYRCEKSAFRGLFDDQKYLDLLPVMDEKAHILRHKGCNVAGWNIETCKRLLVGKEVLIDGIFPIIFIHFNNTTIREIANGNDALLAEYFEKYFQNLIKYSPTLVKDDLVLRYPFTDRVKYAVWKLFTAWGL